MRRGKPLPIALTIAGSDSGGGAGVQADLKTFATLGVHGTSVITCTTAQNPARVLAIEPCSPKIIRAQLEAVFSGLKPAAVKTGLLFSSSTIQTIAGFLQNHPRVPLVVDPVMITSSGTRLMKRATLRTLVGELLPRATLLTPNVHEAEVLAESRITEVEHLRRAAKEMHARFGFAVLVKGGHLRGMREAVDIFYDGKEELLLRAALVRHVKTHGTGCTYSAAITAFLAKGDSLRAGVIKAKNYITRAIANSRRLGRHQVLGWAGSD
jgi:hydroxymethylpyrimidine/phosphomethylpyrimidine kinase